MRHGVYMINHFSLHGKWPEEGPDCTLDDMGRAFLGLGAARVQVGGWVGWGGAAAGTQSRKIEVM